MPNDARPVRAGSTRLASLETGGFRVLDASFPPLLSLPRHYHERAGFSVVLEGAIAKDFSGKQYTSPACGVVTMPPGEKHKAWFAREGAHLLIVEPANALEENLRPCAGVLDRVNHFRDDAVAGIAWRIAHELQDPDDFSCLAVEGLVLELMVQAARGSPLSGACGERYGEHKPGWLVRAQEYLHDNFSSSIQIGEVAAAAGVHPVYLARVFRSFFGESPGEYLRRLRLRWAERQLATSDTPLSDIALQAGFSDQSHFTRAFKRHSGLTPGRYRSTLRG